MFDKRNFVEPPNWAHKVISLMLSVCLLTGSAADAAVPEASGIPIPASISLPSEFGNIEEFHPGSTGKTVIFIQDAHDVLQAQENIAAMITHLVENQSVKTVYEEGYEGPVPTDALFKNISDPEVKRKTAYYFLDQLKIGGAEYAHINRSRDFRLIGADSLQDHFENVDWYSKAVRVQGDVEEDFLAVERELENLTRSLGLKKLQDFLRAKKRFEETKTDFAVYLREVCRLYLASPAGGQFEILYPASAEMLRALDTKQADLLDRVNQRGASELLLEMKRLEDGLAEALLESPREKQLYEYFKAVRLFHRLNKLEVTPAEYQASKETLDAFKTQDLAAFLAREGKKTIVLPRRWEESLQCARGFYETAMRRDEKIREAVEEFSKIPDEKTAVLVYGGFHSDRIRSILENLGMGYAVAVPRVTHLDERHQEYYRQGMAAGSGIFASGIASGMARLITLFEMENSGRPEVRQRIAEEMNSLSGIVRNLSGDLPEMAREADLRFRKTRKNDSGQTAARAELRMEETAEDPDREDVRSARWQAEMARADLEAAPEVLKQYALGEVQKISPTAGGIGEHGKSLQVTTSKGKYILKPLTRVLYPELTEGARFEVSVVRELVRKGIPAADLVPTTKPAGEFDEDRYFVEAANGKIYLLYHFVEGQNLTPETLNTKQFENSIDVLAAMHKTLRDFQVTGKRTRPSILDFENQKERIKQLQARLVQKQADPSAVLTRGERFFLQNASFLLEQISLLNLNLPPPVYARLPQTLVHGDFHPGNMTYEGDQVKAVFDWDHLRKEVRIYDFFKGIFKITTDDRTFNLQGLRQEVERYQKNQALTEEEIQAIPEMARRHVLDMMTWMVRPEKLSERHLYDLSAVDPLEQSLAIIDRNGNVYGWFSTNIEVLRDIDEKIRSGAFSRELHDAALGKQAHSALRVDPDAEMDESPFEETEEPSPERRADKIVSKLLKHWYRSKTHSMGPAIEALKDRTLRAHPMGTPNYMKAAAEFDQGLLAILDEAVAAESERLSQLKTLTTDLFIYHAGIEGELVTKEGKKIFRERYGSDVPDFSVRPGDSFKAGQLTPVFSELIANIRHVDPMGAMFFYRLDDDPKNVQFIIRDGGALTSRAEGVRRSIMGEEYPDEFGRVRKHGYHNAIDAVIRRILGGEVIVQYDKKSERYFSGWFASLVWVRSLNRWTREHFALPIFGIEGEIIGRPWMETGVSKIKHKQGLKVKLLIPRVRSELRTAPEEPGDEEESGFQETVRFLVQGGAAFTALKAGQVFAQFLPAKHQEFIAGMQLLMSAFFVIAVAEGRIKRAGFFLLNAAAFLTFASAAQVAAGKSLSLAQEIGAGLIAVTAGLLMSGAERVVQKWKEHSPKKPQLFIPGEEPERVSEQPDLPVSALKIYDGEEDDSVRSELRAGIPEQLSGFQYDNGLARDENVIVTVKGMEQSATDERALQSMLQPGPQVIGGAASRPYKEGRILAVSLKNDSMDEASSFWSERALEPHDVDFSGSRMAVGGNNTITLLNRKTGRTKIYTYPWFAHIHTVQFSPDGRYLLAASTGFDAVYEIDTYRDRVVWEWNAWEHGYNQSMFGNFLTRSQEEARKLEAEHREVIWVKDPSTWGEFGIPTRQRAVHLNSAMALDSNTILISLFHRGETLVVDKASGKTLKVLSGFSSPHGFRKIGNNHYLVTSTRDGKFQVFDSKFEPVREITLNGMPGVSRPAQLGEWLQNVRWLYGQIYAAVDIHRSKIWVIDLEHKTYRGMAIPRDWAVQEVRLVPREWKKAELVRRLFSTEGQKVALVEDNRISESRSELRTNEPFGRYREIRTYEDVVSVNERRVEEALSAGAITPEKAENYKRTFRGIRRVSAKALQLYADSARGAGLPVYPVQAVWVGGRVQGASLKQLVSPELGRDSDIDLVVGFSDSDGLLPKFGKYESMIAAAFIQALSEEDVPGALDYEETLAAAAISERAREILARYREETEPKTRIQLIVKTHWKPLRSEKVQGHPLNFPELLLAEIESFPEAAAGGETFDRSELRDFSGYAEDYLTESLRKQEPRLYHETARQAEARYEAAAKENEAVWKILRSAMNVSREEGFRNVEAFLDVFETSFHVENGGLILRDWIASDSGVTQSWAKIKENLERGVLRSWQVWEEDFPEVSKVHVRDHFLAMTAVYQNLFREEFAREALERILSRTRLIVRGYRKSETVRSWSPEDSRNAFEISGQYAGLDFVVPWNHQVRVTISNPRSDARTFPYLTAVIDQTLAADFLSELKGVNDLFKRWPWLAKHARFSISYKKTAVLALLTAALSLLFGPAAGRIGLLIEFLAWGTAAVLWIDIFQIKSQVRREFEEFADKVQEESGMWTVITGDDPQSEAVRSELRSGISDEQVIRSWAEREKDYIRDVMTYARGVQTDAVKILGISRSKLSRYLKARLPQDSFSHELPRDFKLTTLAKLKRAYAISALILHAGNQRETTRKTGIAYRTMHDLVEESEFEMLRGETPEVLLRKFAEEVKLAFSPEEIRNILGARFDLVRDTEILKNLKRVLGVAPDGRAEIWHLAAKITQRENEDRREGRFQKEADFRAATEAFRERLSAGETVDSIFSEAAAVFKSAARFRIGQYPSDEQVAAAIAIHRGSAVEKEPGEGKTLSIAMAAYINALSGRAAHIHTFNSYLAGRDAQEMGPVFDLLGMRVGVMTEADQPYLFDPASSGSRRPGKKHLSSSYKDNQGHRQPVQKKDVYRSDIVYGVKDLFVFDFLYDQRKQRLDQKVQPPGGPSIVILDEGDATLLDESGYPLILASPDALSAARLRKVDYLMLYQTALALSKDTDYEIDPVKESVELHRHGLLAAIHYLKYLQFDTLKLTELMREHELGNLLRQALLTKHFNERDGDYILRNGKIELVDEFTGRVKSHHVLGNHRHQFIAAKETYHGNEAELLEPTFHNGLITYQNYYRMMQRRSRFSIITGTMGNDAAEIEKTYGLTYISIPKQSPTLLVEHPPVVTRTKNEKDRLIAGKIAELHAAGRPVLVFVKRISDARALARALEEESLDAAVIDGLDLEEEVLAVANAGKKGQITIATSVAGRGVNIKIEDDVRALGGLAVIMTRKSRSRRIDDQAKLRAARRGDPGEVYWFLSEEDESFRLFGDQARSEEILRQSRRQILFYDDELDPYRRVFYEARDLFLELTKQERLWTRERQLNVIDHAWQRYLMGLEHAMYRREPEGYLAQVRDGFRLVQEVLENSFITSGGADVFREFKETHVLPLNGEHGVRSELRGMEHSLEQYVPYPEVSPVENLGREETLSKARSLIEGSQPDPRKPIMVTRFLQQGTQGMNLTTVHTPGPAGAIAVRAHPDVKADEIYYVKTEEGADEALEAAADYLAFAYPEKTFDVEIGLGSLPSGDQDVVMITVHDRGALTKTVPPYSRQQPVHSISGVSTAQTYNQITGQSPADSPKLLVTKFRSLDPRDQDKGRSELRAPLEEGPVHPAGKGYGEFAVMAGAQEVQGRKIEATDKTPVAFYFNIHTDRILENPEKWIKARVHYKTEKDVEWKNDLEMTLYDNFENGTYRVGVTLPSDFSGTLTFQYSLDGGKTWPYWANQGTHENYEVTRTHAVTARGQNYEIRELPEGQLKTFFDFDARLKNPWGETFWEHLETAYGARAIVALRNGSIAAYLVYQPTESGMQVLKYAVDPAQGPRMLLRVLWRMAQKKLRDDGKEVLTLEAAFRDLKYFGKSKHQHVQKSRSSGKKDFYTLDYYSPLWGGRPEEGGEIPEEYVPSPMTFLRAWALRQTPGAELSLNFEDIRGKYPGLSALMVRRILGEHNLKPRGGYPAEALLIRDMNDEDLDDVMRIESAAFRVPDRWSPWGFQEKPKEDETREDSGGGLMDEVEEGFNRFKTVAVDEEGRVVGYIVYQIFEERIDIQKMAVDPAHRFSYIGSQMLEHIKWIMNKENLSFVSADVPVQNEPVSEFFKKAGFVSLSEQDESWQKKSVTEFVFWHPEIDANLLQSKEQAARFLRKLREMKKYMEEQRELKMAASPKGVLESLKRKEVSPWTRDSKTVKQPAYKTRIRAADLSSVEDLASFAKEQSRFEWTREAFRDFLNRGGKILEARSYGRLTGYLAYSESGETYEILDAAFSARTVPGAMLRRFTEHLQDQDAAKTASPNRMLWELPVEDFADGGRNFRTRAGFKFLDEYELKDGKSLYLLEKTIRKIPEGEKHFRRWAQSLERTPVTMTAFISQAEEFGLNPKEAEKILAYYGVSLVTEKPAAPSRTLPEEGPYVSRDPVKGLHIRWMIRRDMPEVLDIEGKSFSMPWTDEDFLRALRQRNVIGMVAEIGDFVKGFMVYSLHRKGLEILNFAVEPETRGRKIGHEMVEKLKGKLSAQQRNWLRVVVRESDLRAQIFWRSQGFSAVQVSRDYFEDTGEDAYLFEYRQDPEEIDFEETARHDRVRDPRNQMHAWALRQPLEKLVTAEAVARYPEIPAYDADHILMPIREQKLKERMLELLPEGSGRELPLTAFAFSKTSGLPAEKVEAVAGLLGLRLKGGDYSQLEVTVRDHKVEDFHLFESKIETARVDRKEPWTFSAFLDFVQNEQGRVLTAEHEHNSAGYLAYHQIGQRLMVERMGILPALNFRGVDRRLLQQLREIAEEDSLTSIVIPVDEQDLHTQLLLKDEGYNLVAISQPFSPSLKKLIFKLEIPEDSGISQPEIPDLKTIRAVHLRPHEGAFALQLDVLGGAQPVILRTTLENLDTNLHDWFGIESAVHKGWQALMWKDAASDEVRVRSLISPVEIQDVESFILTAIQNRVSAPGSDETAKAPAKDYFKKNHRSELRSTESESGNVWPEQWREEGQISILGEGFEEERAAVEKFFGEFFSGVLQNKPGSKFLDLGTGRLFVPRIGAAEALKISGSSAEFHGVDSAPLDPSFIPAGQGIYFHQTRIENTAEAFPPEFFDAATASYGLEYVQDPGRALEALNKVLKPGAPAALVIHHSGSIIAESVRERLWEMEEIQKSGVVQALLDYTLDPGPETSERVLAAHSALQETVRSASGKETDTVQEVIDQMELILIAGEKAIPALEEMRGDISSHISLFKYYLEHAAAFGDPEKEKLKTLFETHGFTVLELERFEVPQPEQTPFLIGWKVLLKKSAAAAEPGQRAELRAESEWDLRAAEEWRKPGIPEVLLFEDHIGSYMKDFSAIYKVLEKAAGGKVSGEEFFDFMTHFSVTRLFRDQYRGSFTGVVSDLLRGDELLLAMFRYTRRQDLGAAYKKFNAYSELANRFMSHESWYLNLVLRQIDALKTKHLAVVVMGPSFGQELFFWAWILQRIKRVPGYSDLTYEIVGYEKFEEMAQRSRSKVSGGGLDILDVVAASRGAPAEVMRSAFELMQASQARPQDFSAAIRVVTGNAESAELQKLFSGAGIISFNNVWAWMQEPERQSVILKLKRSAIENPGLVLVGVDVMGEGFQDLKIQKYHPSFRSELRAKEWAAPADIYRDLDRLHGTEKMPGSGSEAQKKIRKMELLESMILDFENIREILRREMGESTAQSVYRDLGILFDQASEYLIAAWILKKDMKTFRLLNAWNAEALRSLDVSVRMAAQARGKRLEEGANKIRSPYIQAYQQSVGRKREAARLMGLPPKTYDHQTASLGIDFEKIEIPPGTLLQRLEKTGQKPAQTIRKELYAVFAEEKNGTTFNLVEFRKFLAAKPGFQFLKSPGFSYARLLWGLNLAEDFLYEASDRKAKYGGLMIRVGESFGFDTPSAKANIERILKELAQFKKKQPETASAFDLLKALAMTKEEVLQELEETYAWNLKKFTDAHPEVSWVVTRGYDELVKLLGIQEEAKKKIEESYAAHLGHLDYAAEGLGVTTPAYKRMAQSAKVDFSKIEIPAGGLLKVLDAKNPEGKKQEILAWLDAAGWTNLNGLKNKAFQNHAYLQEKVFSISEVLWGLGIAPEFAARYRALAGGGITSPNQLGMKFGWPKGRAKPTLSSIVDDPRIAPFLPARSELRFQDNSLESFYKPVKKPGAAMIDFRDLVTFTTEEVREAAITVSQRSDVRFVIHNVMPEHERVLALKDLFKSFPNVVWTQAGGEDVFRSLGPQFRENGIVAFARRDRDLTSFSASALETIRFFAVSEDRPGTFAVALSYDPDQILFQSGIEKRGVFYEVKPFLADLAASYLNQFAFAASA